MNSSHFCFSSSQVELHQLVVQRYNDKCNGAFHLLPDDGYVYQKLLSHMAASGVSLGREGGKRRREGMGGGWREREGVPVLVLSFISPVEEYCVCCTTCFHVVCFLSSW